MQHHAGQTISNDMLAPLIFGSLSDRYGCKPVVTFGCIIFILAGIGYVVAPSLALLITYRILQGIGAAVMPLAIVIARESFDERVVREKISYIVMAIFVSRKRPGRASGLSPMTFAVWGLILSRRCFASPGEDGRTKTIRPSVFPHLR
jgi:MFS family permease